MKKLIALFAIVVLATSISFASTPSKANATINLTCPGMITSEPNAQTLDLVAGKSVSNQFVWGFQYRGAGTAAFEGGAVKMGTDEIPLTYVNLTGTGSLNGWGVSVTWGHTGNVFAPANGAWTWDPQALNCDVAGTVTEDFTITSPIGAVAGIYEFSFTLNVTE